MTDLAITAARLLRDYGEPVNLTNGQVGVIEFDPITGDPITPAAPIAISTMGYLGRYTATDADGTNILMTDARLILPKLSLRPQKGWFASAGSPEMNDFYEYFFEIVGSATARIMSVQSVRLKASDVIYICQLRAS